MSTPLWAIGLVVLATVVGSFGSLMLKFGSAHLDRKKGMLKNLLNKRIWAGVVLYGISTVMFIVALKNGQLSVLYPLVAVGYIWVALLSIKFLKEKMNIWKWTGILLIIGGVCLIGLGS